MEHKTLHSVLVVGCTFGELRFKLGKKKEPKPKRSGCPWLGWGSSTRGGGGAKSSVCPSKPGKSNLFGRDMPGFCRDIPAVPEKFEKKSLSSSFGPYLTRQHLRWQMPNCVSVIQWPLKTSPSPWWPKACWIFGHCARDIASCKQSTVLFRLVSRLVCLSFSRPALLWLFSSLSLWSGLFVVISDPVFVALSCWFRHFMFLFYRLVFSSSSFFFFFFSLSICQHERLSGSQSLEDGMNHSLCM